MNWSAADVVLVSPLEVTVTSTVPADSAGEVATMEVDELTVIAVAAVLPNATVAPEVKPVPVMVTEVPPDVGPEVGDMAVIVGAGVDDIEAVVKITMSSKVRPNASQKLAETHDTPLSQLTPEGRVWLVQVEPSQESAAPLSEEL